MPRWSEPLCPRVKGLNDAMDNFVTARIRAVAAAVGAPHDESSDCKANVVIFFTFVPQKLVYDVLRIDSSLLGFHYPSETKKYTVFNHAIQGWYVTATRNSNGLEVIDDPQGFGTYAEVDLGGGSLGSRLRTRISALIIYATIIADIDKLKGMTIGSISDYLAVLTLTGARLSDDCSQLPSIMDLMASGCADDKRPNQITAGDLAYMRALYSVLPDTPVALERSSIEDQMFRAFKRGR